MKKENNPAVIEIIEAMKELGGFCSYKELYEKLRKRNNIKLENYSSEVEWQSRIRFLTEKFSSDSKVHKEEDDDIFYSVNGLGSGVWGLREYEDYRASKSAVKTQNQKNDIQDIDPELLEFPEGDEKEGKHKSKERNAKLIRFAKNLFKQKHGALYCEVCGFDFAEKYGKWGEDYIEAHHDVNPICERTEKKGTKISDLVMLCANCHRVIHRKRPWLRAEELKKIVEANGSELHA